MRHSPHLFVFLGILLLASLLAAQESSAFALASDLSELALVDPDGKPRFVRQVLQGKAIVFVVLPGAASGDLCAIAQSLSSLVIQEPLPIALIHSAVDRHSAKCTPRSSPVFHFPARGTRQQDPTPFAILVDDAFHVRWRSPFSPSEAGLAALRTGVNAWLQARQSYEANCGHCHGMDGAQASSPDVKSLVGITRKYSEADVLRLGAQFGGVDMTGWTDAKRENLLLYLRGL